MFRPGAWRRFKTAKTMFHSSNSEPKQTARRLGNGLDDPSSECSAEKALPRKRRSGYTEGELNKLIDSVLHPIARQDTYFWLADTLLHAIVEQDPKVTLEKFMHYTLPKILDQAAKRQKRQRRTLAR